MADELNSKQWKEISAQINFNSVHVKWNILKWTFSAQNAGWHVMNDEVKDENAGCMLTHPNIFPHLANTSPFTVC